MAITKEALTEKTKELINNLSNDMVENIDKALNSGAINLETFDDDYLLPKILVTALLKHELWQHKPSQKFAEKYAENIYKFL